MLIKRTHGTEHPHYSILVGGGGGENDPGLGQRLAGRYPKESAPHAIVAVAECYQRERSAGETFQQFVWRIGVDRLSAAARAATGDGVQ